jgi:nucleoid-associated protein YgaU
MSRIAIKPRCVNKLAAESDEVSRISPEESLQNQQYTRQLGGREPDFSPARVASSHVEKNGSEVRMFKSSIAFLAAGLIAVSAAVAQTASRGNVLEIAPNAPDTYVVQRGDTLWSIASKFLKEPWKWPQIWRLNKDQIKNPHLIYPGEVVRLDRATGTLSIERLSPQVRTEPLAGEAIPSIPAKVIEPFLSQPLVVERNGLERAPRIVATQEGRYNIGAGSRAYVEGLGESSEPLWQVYRQGVPLVDPETRETLGFEAIYLGQARTLKLGAPATMQVMTAKREMGIGDRLVAEAPRRTFSYVPKAPDKPVTGRVMSVYDGREDSDDLLALRERRAGPGMMYAEGFRDETGPLSIVSINRGSRQGLEQGNVLALYKNTVVTNDRSIGPFYMGRDRAPVVQLPEERYGLMLVFRVFENVSYALVMNASLPVATNDVFRNP